ncbi:MAG: TraR/DksA family transcriptional regulator [Actinobacteria bacterium]|nr:TraR/DksA family transcriptional regulator [Actinomycetota bacterium]
MTTGDDRYDALVRLHQEATQRVERLALELEELTAFRRGESDDDEHDPEGVTLSSEWSRLSGISEIALARLSQIEAAFERWQAGTYGICERCGQAIPLGRLDARPFATMCVPCAEASGG